MSEWRDQVTTGNVLQVGAMLVVLAGAWTVMDQRSQETAKSLAKIEQSLNITEGRVRVLEAGSARDGERFANILAALSRIDQRLEKLGATP